MAQLNPLKPTGLEESSYVASTDGLAGQGRGMPMPGRLSRCDGSSAVSWAPRLGWNAFCLGHVLVLSFDCNPIQSNGAVKLTISFSVLSLMRTGS